MDSSADEARFHYLLQIFSNENYTSGSEDENESKSANLPTEHISVTKDTLEDMHEFLSSPNTIFALDSPAPKRPFLPKSPQEVHSSVTPQPSPYSKIHCMLTEWNLASVLDLFAKEPKIPLRINLTGLDQGQRILNTSSYSGSEKGWKRLSGLQKKRSLLSSIAYIYGLTPIAAAFNQWDALRVTSGVASLGTGAASMTLQQVEGVPEKAWMW